jgi:hypothetical protein
LVKFGTYYIELDDPRLQRGEQQGTMRALAKPGFRSLKRGLALLAVLVSPTALWGQSCPLCYQVAANSGSHVIQALKSGILVLLFPPLLIYAGFAFLAYRKRNQSVED